MKLILVRHGETLENKQGIAQGHIHGQLSPEGIDQAKKVALRFKDEKIDFIYSSDLNRAVDTAREIVKYHPNVDVVLDQRARERFLGGFQGKVSIKIDWDNLPGDVENDEQILKRAKDFLDEIYHKHQNHTVLIVCHAGIKQVMLTVILNKSLSEVWAMSKMGNTAVSVFEVTEKETKTHALGCTKHLEEEVA